MCRLYWWGSVLSNLPVQKPPDVYKGFNSYCAFKGFVPVTSQFCLAGSIAIPLNSSSRWKAEILEVNAFGRNGKNEVGRAFWY